MGKAAQTFEPKPVRPCKYIATAPATCGAAMDVPLASHSDVLLMPSHAHGVKLPVRADTIRSPGAKRSTPGPQFDAWTLSIQRLPVQSIAPTVKTSTTLAGATLRAST